MSCWMTASGLDLMDVWTGPRTPRRINVPMDHLLLRLPRRLMRTQADLHSSVTTRPLTLQITIAAAQTGLGLFFI